MSEKEIKTLIQRVTEEIYHQWNPDAADQFYTADHVRHDPTLPQPIEGIEAMKDRLRSLLAAFPDAQLDVEDVVVEGNRFANRWTMRATHQGEFSGVPPTGKQVTLTGMSFGRIENGKIAEVWDQVDALGLMQQLGVVSPPQE
jgi:steroid delta-isomerase-like uncharacterized protein